MSRGTLFGSVLHFGSGRGGLSLDGAMKLNRLHEGLKNARSSIGELSPKKIE